MKQIPVPLGIHTDLPDGQYHADRSFSRSFAWKAYSKTWAHAVGEEQKESNAFDVGHGIHVSILEPERFEDAVLRGPIDRRGNRWKEARACADDCGALLLVDKDYDAVLAVRDAVHADYGLHNIITGGQAAVENSAIWVDKETGERCRVRPDLVRPDLRIMLDLKSSVSAAHRDVQKYVATYGYHLQDAMYRHGWESAGGGEIEGYVFLVVEKEPPYEHALFELDETASHEGWLIFRRMLDEYHQCKQTGVFPGYARQVQDLSLPPWAYHEQIETEVQL